MNRNQRLAAARGWAHDQVCMSGCTGTARDEHARRCHSHARGMADATTFTGLMAAVHQMLCIPAMRGECTQTDRHLTVLAGREPNQQLAVLLGHDVPEPAGMMGRTHSLSGAVAFLAAAPMLARWTPVSTGEVIGGMLVAAGAAMLPDTDHANASVAHAFGWPSQALCRGMAALFGGHRNGTHSLLFVALAAVLGVAAVHVGGPFLYLTVAFAVVFIPPYPHGPLRTALSVVLTALVVAVLFAAGVRFGWLPYALTIGVTAHIVGDMLTPERCPLLWPVIRWRIGLPLVQTDHAVERLAVYPALLLGGLAIVTYRAGWWPVMLSWAHSL